MRKLADRNPDVPIRLVADRVERGEEVVTFNGRIFGRSKDYGEHGHFSAEDDALPQIVCECGNDTFRVRNENYACIAACAVCGKEGIVYEG